MKSEPGPLLTVAYTCDTDGVMTAKSISQGHISDQSKMFLILFHFLNENNGHIS